jgi:hypothetical protein
VDLPDKCRVDMDVRVLESPREKAELDEVYAILSKRFDSGETDVAAQHDEHQP